MSTENYLSNREMAIEGYGTTYKGILPDGTATGLMSYDGETFKHYVETGKWKTRHSRWERNYNHTPLWYALEMLGEGAPKDEMNLAEVVYEGTYYEPNPMENVGLDKWHYAYHDKMDFRKKVLAGKIRLPAPAVFTSYGDIYTEAGYGDEVKKIFEEWAGQ
jgi:hypothetical protein